MRALLLLICLAAPAGAETTVAAPVAAVANYDPTLSAKEAVLANWDLAASGIRAGALVGDRVVEAIDRGVPYARAVRIAGKAEGTMVQRWNAAQWIFAAAPDLGEMDRTILLAAAAAASADCETGPCDAESAALRAAFVEAGAIMAGTAEQARGEIEARVDRGDAALLSEQLQIVADYLEGGAWSRDLALADLGRDREEVAARLVGALSIWRNLEPYVGLAAPEIDDEINAAAEALLRTLRLGERQPGPLTEDGPELMALRDRAAAVAAGFREAAALFTA